MHLALQDAGELQVKGTLRGPAPKSSCDFVFNAFGSSEEIYQCAVQRARDAGWVGVREAVKVSVMMGGRGGKLEPIGDSVERRESPARASGLFFCRRKRMLDSMKVHVRQSLVRSCGEASICKLAVLTTADLKKTKVVVAARGPGSSVPIDPGYSERIANKGRELRATGCTVGSVQPVNGDDDDEDGDPGWGHFERGAFGLKDGGEGAELDPTDPTASQSRWMKKQRSTKFGTADEIARLTPHMNVKPYSPLRQIPEPPPLPCASALFFFLAHLCISHRFPVLCASPIAWWKLLNCSVITDDGLRRMGR